MHQFPKASPSAMLPRSAARTSSATIRSSSRVRSSIKASLAALIAIGAGSQALTANAVPVIPNAAGFGITTPAGRGGTVYKVTSLNETGSGSITACVNASGPRVCVFEVSGTIKLSGDLILRNPNITIAGQTAPSPGVMFRGGALLIKTSDVLIQHVRFRPGDDAAGTTADNRDALKIESENPIRNIVIDHCSFSWAIDETASLWSNWDGVVLSNNIFAEALNDSLHSKGAHGYGVLFGPVKGRATAVNNLLAHMVERNPLSRASELAFVNNVVYNRRNMDVDLQGEDGIVTNNSVVGNVFIRGSDYTRTNKPVLLRTDGSLAVMSSTRVHLADNSAQETGSDPFSVASTYSGSIIPEAFRAGSPPVWPPNLVPRPTSNGNVLNYVLTNAGARPGDRDSVDKRIVQSVRDRSGRIINCVAPNGTARCELNAGGWPSYPQNRRTLTLPANPNTVTASGYTNLELWLHSMAAKVEGRTSPPVPPVLQVR
jgi:pectate lyase